MTQIAAAWTNIGIEPYLDLSLLAFQIKIYSIATNFIIDMPIKLTHTI